MIDRRMTVFDLAPSAKDLVLLGLAGAWTDLTAAALAAGVPMEAIRAIERGAPGTMKGYCLVAEDAAGAALPRDLLASADEALTELFRNHRAQPEQLDPGDVDATG